jgi:acyl-CoA thioester hydrolase
MACEFKISRRVEFSETDMAGIVHFANFFRYMEYVEHAFYRSLGFSVIMDRYSPPLGFPRVHAECDYKAPLKFEEMLEMHLIVREKRSKVINYEIRFSKLVEGVSREIARGKLTVVCVAHHPGGKLSSVEIPSDLSALIEAAPAGSFA